MPRSLPGPVMALPSMEASPVDGSSNPAMMRRSVDFPHPDAPIRQTNSPWEMVKSTGAKASTSSSPTAKRLVTPRTVRVSECGALLKMLRTPAQQAIADRDDDPIGDEAAGTNHDHAGDDEIGARQRAAIHHHRTQAGWDARHFTDHDQYPGDPVRDPQSVENGRQGSRKHDLAEHSGARAAEHRGGLEQARIDRAYAEHRVQKDRIEGA